MAIDIFWQNGKEKRKVGSFSIQENLLSLFEAKTGITIDEYGRTPLSINQLKVLLTCANELKTPIDLTILDTTNAAYILEGD